jgi:membrane-associated phospholipid phosphatase
MATVSELKVRRGERSSAGPSLQLRSDSGAGLAPLNAKPSWARLLAGPALLALFGVAAMWIDMPLAHWIKGKHYPNDLKKLFDLAEVFGHGFGAGSILFSVWVLAPQVRARLPRVICAVLGAGITGTLCKLFLARQRPFRVVSFEIGALGTFGDWFPMFSNNSAWQSFPSGHSAMAAGLAVGLTALFPRGKWLFVGLTVLVMLQRMFSTYHFLSDTMWGAAIGWLFASIILSDGWLTRPFQRLEQRLAARS